MFFSSPTMASSSLYDRAREFWAQDNYINAFEVIDEIFSVQGSDDCEGNFIQGRIFTKLAEETEESDLKFTYLLSSVECFSRNPSLLVYLADSLFNLAEQIGSILFYKQSLMKANEALSTVLVSPFLMKDFKERMEYIVEHAGSKIAEFKTSIGSIVRNFEQVRVEENEEMGVEDNEETGIEHRLVRRMRVYWNGCGLEYKRRFMRVSWENLMGYIKNRFDQQQKYGQEPLDALKRAITYAKKKQKWILWPCRVCTKKFYAPGDYKSHLELEHAASVRHDLPWKICAVWAHKISVGVWKPVNVVAAVKRIKDRLADVETFVYLDGWCKDWPLAEHEERSKLLKDVKSLLVSLIGRKILTVNILYCVMHSVVRKLEKLDVSKQMLTDCRLLDTPQNICFLECGELSQVLDFLRNIKCESDDGTDMVCRAVERLCDETRFKEKIDFDSQFSILLLDKRLLHSKVDRFDDEGKVSVYDPVVHYAKAQVRGDDMVSWLTDGSSLDVKFQFPEPIKEHNLVVWMAVLRAVQFTCRILRTKLEKRQHLVGYRGELDEAKQLCVNEYEKRKTCGEDQWIRYASLLSDRCQESDAGNPLTTNLLCAVRDVLEEEALYPTFDCKNVADEIVLNSLELLESNLLKKVGQIDSKILLIENSRINLLNVLTRLSAFDHRSYVRGYLKGYLFANLSRDCRQV